MLHGALPLIAPALPEIANDELPCRRKRQKLLIKACVRRGPTPSVRLLADSPLSRLREDMEPLPPLAMLLGRQRAVFRPHIPAPASRCTSRRLVTDTRPPTGPTRTQIAEPIPSLDPFHKRPRRRPRPAPLRPAVVVASLERVASPSVDAVTELPPRLPYAVERAPPVLSVWRAALVASARPDRPEPVSAPPLAAAIVPLPIRHATSPPLTLLKSLLSARTGRPPAPYKEARPSILTSGLP